MKSLKNQRAALARQYAAAPMLQQSAIPAWQALANHAWRHASIIRGDLRVTEVDDGMPYPDARAMFADIASGRLLVSRANCEHPVWTEQENVAFRIVHDVMGHYAAHRAGLLADFSWQGECDAFDWHRRSLPIGSARKALLTEVLGQAAYAIESGDFGVQKVVFLD